MNSDAVVIILVLACLVLGPLAVALGASITPKAIREAVAACEKDLPRSQKCDWKPVAFVVPTT